MVDFVKAPVNVTRVTAPPVTPVVGILVEFLDGETDPLYVLDDYVLTDYVE